MSAVFTFFGNDFIAMAGDRREVNILDNTYRDDCKKIFKKDDFIYGTTGSDFLIDLFEKGNNASKYEEFLRYADAFLVELNQTKGDKNAKANWCRQKFCFTLQVAFIENQTPRAGQYMITWREDGYIATVLPKGMTTKDVPLSSLPDMGEHNEWIEEYIKKNHPINIIEAQALSKLLFDVVSKNSSLVSESFDFDAIKLCR